MQMITLLLFFVYSWGLGFSATSFLKISDDFFERNIMRIGLGLSIFIVLAAFLDLIHISLDWKIFLIISLIYPTFYLIRYITKNGKSPLFYFNFGKLNLTKSSLISFLVLLIFLFSFYMYVEGAFAYSYLENDDPWSHATSVKYIATEKTLTEPNNYDFKYLDPYPPGYDLVMGILHQTEDSLMWVMKFFNALIISLGILFFYFFAKIFTKDKKHALFSTFILATIPCYFTHFIWSISLVVPLFFVSVYYLELISVDKKAIYISGLAIAGMLLVQPSMALKLGLLLIIYFIVNGLIYKINRKQIFLSYIFGIILSLLWWFQNGIDMFLRGAKAGGGKNTLLAGESLNFFEYIQRAFPPDSGTATQIYSFGDFLIAKPFGGINVQIGFGLMISCLLIIGLVFIIIKYKSVFKKQRSWILISLCWLILMFLNVNSLTFNLPVGFFSFRSWLLLAIPVALLSYFGLNFLIALGKQISVPKILIIVLVVTSVFFTSGYQKYHHNTLDTWPPGHSWTSIEEIKGYLWLKELPPNTKVFTYSTSDKFIIGFDKKSCFWCEDVTNFRINLLDHNLSELTTFLKKQNYEYLVISGMSYIYLNEKFGENATSSNIQSLLENLQTSNELNLAYQTQGFLALKIN